MHDIQPSVRIEHKPENFQQAVSDVMVELSDLMLKKQRDYGHDNIMAYGEFGVMVRVNDKIARLKNLVNSETVPSNEKLEDTWKDLANYAIIALMLRKGTFTLPLK